MFEKRYNKRQPTPKSILVVARFMNLRSKGRLLNASLCGAAIQLEKFHVPIGTCFELCIAIPLNNGKMYRLHFKNAVVTHITNGTIGVITGNFERI